ncbi:MULTISPECIES: ComF family protein [unclassified Colwellia]|uniref:ComF family protein n=1 Tax=unclassified Colwellia TaxID=196834 RepID=UPI0015F63161|nr:MULTISPECIES: ComF family protein [unclassified Colwellia]MBA6348535.1 ComF family protein [Colwellia sp. BRX8-9]MBA6352381.1 ComF family protein [Colwellia sp. BRX9-1]MBA6355152.1 ComF family protein [Colwellia sp. BRX8-3]MBA6361210.1 ComF family protein [Colwellia sp. BRX8-6]MBA6366298.1 ComF family protein [Colwellia sp. BRX8-5]
MEFNHVKFIQYLKQKSFNFIDRLKLFTTQLSCCDLCGGRCQSQALICDFCLADLPLFDLKKLHGDLLTWPAINTILPKRIFDQLISVSAYQWPIDLWVRQLKYHGRFELVPLLSVLLFKQWKNALPYENKPYTHCPHQPLLLSVPIHMKKWQTRGFNQAHLLAEDFARLAQMPYCPDALQRISHDKSQAGQTGVIRRKNLRHAFKLSSEYLVNKSDQQSRLPEHVLLLDDVVTTGSTCNEICRLLKANGVKKVTVLSLCLSLPNNKIQ